MQRAPHPQTAQRHRTPAQTPLSAGDGAVARRIMRKATRRRSNASCAPSSPGSRETYPMAARSLAEGLEETLTLQRLGINGLLQRSLSSTNLIESCLPPRAIAPRASEPLATRQDDPALERDDAAESRSRVSSCARLSTLKSPRTTPQPNDGRHRKEGGVKA